ncbi:MAG: hypothetical protein DRP13_03225, partial [Candidatus Aenigmatarchaeota archaeon]
MTNGEMSFRENLLRSVYREGWLRSFFGLFIAFLFYYIFHSFFLALLAFAFLFYIPVPLNTKKNNDPNTVIFLISMIAILVLAFGKGLELDLGGFWPWEWNTSALIFLTVWIISFLVGVSGDTNARQSIGPLVIGVSFFLFAFGSGTQEVGSAFFGPWWPNVYNNVQPLLKPFSTVFSNIFSTFHNAFTLLTNPVGYATQLMNATYAKNPTGKTGAFGVDFDSFDISPVFVKQPYTVSVILKNDGAADAKNLMVFLSAGVKAPKQEKGAFKAAEWSKPITIEGLGIKNCEGQKFSGANNNWAGEQWEKIKSWFAKLFGREPQGNEICEQTRSKLTKQDIWQVTFMSTGITCDAVVNYNLRKKFIPFNVTVMYDYESNSSLKIEFVSNEEWEKLIRTGEINRRLRFIQSECSSAPVKLSIGTPGLKNPLKEDQEFYIGINLGNEDRYGQIVKIDEITLNLPKEFSENFDITDCTFRKTQQNNRIVWKGLPENTRTLHCRFRPKQGSDLLKGAPSKTFIVTAYAKYTFIHTETKSSKLE